MPDDRGRSPRNLTSRPHLRNTFQSFHFLLATSAPLHPNSPKRPSPRHPLAFIYMQGSMVPLTRDAGTGALFFRPYSPCFPKLRTWGPVWGNRLAPQSWKYRPRARLAGCSIRSLYTIPWRRSWSVMP